MGIEVFSCGPEHLGRGCAPLSVCSVVIGKGSGSYEA